MGIELCVIIILSCCVLFGICLYYIDDADHITYLMLVTSFVISTVISAKFGLEAAYRKAAFGKNPYKTEIQYKQINDSVFVPIDTVLIEKNN